MIFRSTLFCSTRPWLAFAWSCLLLLLGGKAAFAQNPWISPVRKAQLYEVHHSARVGGVVGSTQADLLEWRLSPDSTAARLLSIQVGLTPRPDWRIVQCLRLRYLNPQGHVDTIQIGGADFAEWATPIELKAGQQLLGISGAGGWFIDAIQFHFSGGQVSPRFGGSGGDTTFDLRIQTRPDGQPRGALLGFYGSIQDSLLESLGLVFWPIE